MNFSCPAPIITIGKKWQKDKIHGDKKKKMERDTVFIKKLFELMIPIMLQDLMLAAGRSGGRVYARRGGSELYVGGFSGDTDPVYTEYVSDCGDGEPRDPGRAVLGKRRFKDTR